ncbi:hypothetical protein RHECNPAF_1760074 [Rhizobium etli CNPAF512]|nr:hypothetical protein RHECNPAF_1760074 [Rhizobium etli CNPAF512]
MDFDARISGLLTTSSPTTNGARKAPFMHRIWNTLFQWAAGAGAPSAGAPSMILTGAPSFFGSPAAFCLTSSLER